MNVKTVSLIGIMFVLLLLLVSGVFRGCIEAVL